jgi:hypothetical protein
LIAISEINYIKHCTDRNYVHKQLVPGLIRGYSGRGVVLTTPS